MKEQTGKEIVPQAGPRFDFVVYPERLARVWMDQPLKLFVPRALGDGLTLELRRAGGPKSIALMVSVVREPVVPR